MSQRICWVCFKQPDRSMVRFVNSEGLEMFIHGHHRTTTIIRAGIEIGITDRRPSKKRFVQVPEFGVT